MTLRTSCIVAIIALSAHSHAAPGLPVPKLNIGGGSVQVAWDGNGTLYATNSLSANGYSPVATDSPYQSALLDTRFFTVGYDLLSYAVVDTNQTTSYDAQGNSINPSEGAAYFGQDADYSGNQASYTDNGDGTVTDNQTGLMWQQVPPEAFYSWTEAQSYAEGLVLAGHDDWRLPTMKESLSLADFTGSSRPEIDKPYIDETVFTLYDPQVVSTYIPSSAENPNQPKRNIDGQFWSSNAYVGLTMNNDSSTFGFNFIDGRIKSYPNGVSSGPVGTSFVRCVRGPTTYGENNYIDNRDGTITDLSTGLMWLQSDSGATVGTLDWIDALAWAENLQYAGYEDWRLPNAKELHTLVDYSRAPDAANPEKRTAAIDPIFNLTEMESWFWTSTSLGDDLFEWAIYICFGRALAVDSVTKEATINAHGAGAMRSDPKTGDPADFISADGGHGPQNDQVRIQNYVRPVRNAFTAEDLKTEVEQPNILLLIVDDWGIDSSGLYNDLESASQPPMPTLETLAQDGILFRNAYAQPTCSPTRMNILTGRYSYRHGVGAPVTPSEMLSESEFTLPEAFATAGSNYQLGSFGKWHLTAGGGATTNAARPNTLGGWPHFEGSMEGGVPDYYLWTKVTNGTTENDVEEYVTITTVNDAINWIGQQGENPWFCWIGFNAAHTPFHRPPLNPALHSYTDLPEEPLGANRRPAYEAALEAMDTEVSRLLGSMDLADTTIIVLGDNGTPAAVVQPPFDNAHAKGSLYEGGTHVPFFISGPSVKTTGESDALVHCVDLFATILDIAGIDMNAVLPEGTEIDSSSLMGLLSGSGGRPYALCESFGSNSSNPGKAVNNGRYKLIRYDSGTEEFFHYEQDENEQDNLLLAPLSGEEEAVYDELSAFLSAL